MKHGPLLSTLTALLVACGAGVTLSVPVAHAEPAPTPNFPAQQGPPQHDVRGSLEFDKNHPEHAPAGANDFTCAPNAQHPYPVLLAHGTDATAYKDFAAISPFLRDQGFCVFALNYGSGVGQLDFSFGTGEERPTYGTIDIRDSAREVAAAVTAIRTATGARKVHLVGFSQGANVTRFYVNRLGGAESTATWTGIASPTYGGAFFGLAGVANTVPGGGEMASGMLAPALVQELEGSEFLTELNGGGDTVPGVHYTTISTYHDEIVHPRENMLLKDPGAVNIFIQDICPQDMGGHFGLTYSPTVRQLLLQALDPQAPPVVCTPVPFGQGFVDTVVGSNT